MKYQFTVTIDENDILEEDVKNAMRAYARQVAREEVHNEITNEVQRVCRSEIKKMNESSMWSPKGVDKLVSEIVRQEFREVLGNSNSLRVTIREKTESAIDSQVTEIQKSAADYVHATVERNKSIYHDLIVEEIKRTVPTEILKAVASCMRDANGTNT